MTADRIDELAERVADEFEEERDPDNFKEVSIVIEDSGTDRPTLIVHANGDNADVLAGRIDEFLRNHGAQTEREHHSNTDIRVLAITE